MKLANEELHRNTKTISQCQIFHNNLCLYSFLFSLKSYDVHVPRETGNNAYAKFWADKQRVLHGIFDTG